MLKAWLAGALVFNLMVEGASAAPYPVSGVKIADLVKILQNKGYRALVTKTKEGKDEIESSTQGAKFWIMLSDCKEDVCETANFNTSFDKSEKNPVTPAIINKYNLDHRFGYATLESDGSPRLDVDFSTKGVSSEYLEDVLGWWDNELGYFTKAIGWS